MWTFLSFVSILPPPNTAETAVYLSFKYLLSLVDLPPKYNDAAMTSSSDSEVRELQDGGHCLNLSSY